MIFFSKFDKVGRIHIFLDDKNLNATQFVIFGEDDYITFRILQDESKLASKTRIPQDECSIPYSCNPYFNCYSGNKC